MYKNQGTKQVNIMIIWFSFQCELTKTDINSQSKIRWLLQYLSAWQNSAKFLSFAMSQSVLRTLTITCTSWMSFSLNDTCLFVNCFLTCFWISSLVIYEEVVLKVTDFIFSLCLGHLIILNYWVADVWATWLCKNSCKSDEYLTRISLMSSWSNAKSESMNSVLFLDSCMN